MIELKDLENLHVHVVQYDDGDLFLPTADLDPLCCDVLFVPRDLMAKADPGINWASAHVFARKGIVFPFRDKDEDGVGVGAADVKEVLLTVPLKRNVFERPDGKYLLVPLGAR